MNTMYTRERRSAEAQKRRSGAQAQKRASAQAQKRRSAQAQNCTSAGFLCIDSILPGIPLGIPLGTSPAASSSQV